MRNRELASFSFQSVIAIVVQSCEFEERKFSNKAKVAQLQILVLEVVNRTYGEEILRLRKKSADIEKCDEIIREQEQDLLRHSLEGLGIDVAQNHETAVFSTKSRKAEKNEHKTKIGKKLVVKNEKYKTKKANLAEAM